MTDIARPGRRSMACDDAAKIATNKALLTSMREAMATRPPRPSVAQRRGVLADATAHSAFAVATGWLIPELLALAHNAASSGEPAELAEWMRTNQITSGNIRDADESLSALVTHSVLWARVAGIAGDGPLFTEGERA